jgi:hypothetical protein
MVAGQIVSQLLYTITYMYHVRSTNDRDTVKLDKFSVSRNAHNDLQRLLR